MRPMALVTAGALALGLSAAGPGPTVTAHPARGATEHAAPPAVGSRQVGTTIVVRVDSHRGPAPTALLGANHHYRRNGYGLWDESADRPKPVVVARAARAGLQSLRFPGGTVANLYDWKRAIGPTRRCQVVGPHGPGKPGEALTKGLAFGPDEYMTFLRQTHARPIIMVPFVTETPADAADWVEYMNSPSGKPGNPHGGVDWADVRAANGHPAPYHVHWWEIGNEQHHEHSRYWMSQVYGRALREYTYGGSEVIELENLGKQCAHPRAGVPSDGTAAQEFGVLYPPVAPASVHVTIGGRTWTRVDDLSSAGPRARVFTVVGGTGKVRFGDGVHGAIPAAGRIVRASYRTVHEGYFDFARRMKEVDPSIDVCSSWGQVAFNRYVGRRPYDCLTAHLITLFGEPGSGDARWSDPLQGHDQMMQKSLTVRGRAQALLDSMPRSTPLLLTEFVTMHGDAKTFPGWNSSVSHAVYMASLWATFLDLGIRWGNGDDFLWIGDRAVLGPAPFFTFTADAVTRRALSPMFSAGGHRIGTRVTGNPVRHPPSDPAYPALEVTATRDHGVLRVLVVNRLPHSGVTAQVRLEGGTARGRATVRSVTGPSFRSRNLPGEPGRVVLHVRHRKVGRHGFPLKVPEASTTVLRIPLR